MPVEIETNHIHWGHIGAYYGIIIKEVIILVLN